MAKYQPRTIRRAPSHVRPLMKIANEMDKQMKRLQKAIVDQIDMAELYRESESTIDGLHYSLKLANQKRSPSEPDPLALPNDLSDLPWEQGIDEGLEDMPSFNQRTSSGNKLCFCMSWWLSDEQIKEANIIHTVGCARG